MVFTGLAFLLLWLIITVFTVEIVKAILIVAIILIVAGLLIGERPWVRP